MNNGIIFSNNENRERTVFMEIKPVKKYKKPSFLTAAVAALSLLSACTTRTTGIAPVETEDPLLDGDVIMEYSETETSESTSAADTVCTDESGIESSGEISLITAPDETETVTSAETSASTAETTTAPVNTTAAITTAATTVTSQATTAETEETDEPCLELEGDVIVDDTDDIEYIVDTPGEAPVEDIDIPEDELTLDGEIDVVYMEPDTEEYVIDEYEEMNVEMAFDGWSSHTLTIAKDTTVPFDYISEDYKIMLTISDPSIQSTYEDLSKKYKKITKTDFGYVFEGKENDTLYTGVVIISNETEEDIVPKLKASVDYLMEIKVI